MNGNSAEFSLNTPYVTGCRMQPNTETKRVKCEVYKAMADGFSTNENYVIDCPNKIYVVYYDDHGVLSVRVHRKVAGQAIIERVRSPKTDGAARFVNFLFYLARRANFPKLKELPLFFE